MKISVSARHRALVAPELCHVHMEVDVARRTASDAAQAATDTANRISADAQQRRDSGGIVDVHVAPLQTWAYRDDSKSELAQHYRAQARLEVIFHDVTLLSEFTGSWGAVEDVNLHRVEWKLTDETRERVEAESLTKAVEEARRRAQAIADAADAGEVQFVEVADPGLLQGPRDYTEPPMMRAAMTEGFGGSSLDVRPQELPIVVELNARFEA